jgi:deazaflavin-dependent oxidoreductase (nitroreductase family)
MPLPKWIAQINKRTFNKLELRRGVRPVLTHVGRSSGKTHHTPLDAHRVDGGFIFIANYGANSDWVRNIIASGTAHLDIGDEQYDLEHPRLLTKEETLPLLRDGTRTPPDFMRVDDFLRMDLLL